MSAVVLAVLTPGTAKGDPFRGRGTTAEASPPWRRMADKISPVVTRAWVGGSSGGAPDTRPQYPWPSLFVFIRVHLWFHSSCFTFIPTWTP